MAVNHGTLDRTSSSRKVGVPIRDRFISGFLPGDRVTEGMPLNFIRVAVGTISGAYRPMVSGLDLSKLTFSLQLSRDKFYFLSEHRSDVFIVYNGHCISENLRDYFWKQFNAFGLSNSHVNGILKLPCT